ncbi:MAG: tRNA pseudouridine(38-40) synthase TruA [Clostridia bacterium]|nr:tRNA pseudouridine(38-40) synthase TruA [Clostridia bacterium]
MRIKLIVSYDGENFSGWQRQKNGIVSIQGLLEEAVYKLTGENVSVVGSGRTDAGVHALGQVAHFDTNSKIPPQKFCLALNTLLPSGVKVLKSQKVKDDFNARRDAKLKTYKYSVYVSNIEKPLKEKYSVRVFGKVDYEKIKANAKKFVGEHDFKCFCASGSEVKTTVRTITELKVVKRGEDLTFLVTGTGFLYNMVRILVGTLIAVGRGDIKEENIDKMLKTGKRSLGGETLPAKGLCLMNVKY